MFQFVSFLYVLAKACVVSLAIPHSKVSDIELYTPTAQNFRIIVLPDTQNYVEDNGEFHENFNAQTRWIVEQVKLYPAGSDNAIEFVTHVGDIVNRGGERYQFDLANTSLSTLGSSSTGWEVPYSLAIGNHDYDLYHHSSKIGNTVAKYLEYWGPDRFANADFFGGADPSGLNTYQYFSAAGVDVLHIALEWQPTISLPARSISPVAWAKQVMKDHRGMPTILTTHEYLTDEPGGRSRYGQHLWNQLIKDSDQIFMVICGHFHDLETEGGFPGGQWHQVSKNARNNNVIEVLQDFQDYPEGGGGWLRSFTFKTQEGKIHVETYNAATGAYNRSSVDEIGQLASDFVLDFDFAQRFNMTKSS